MSKLDQALDWRGRTVVDCDGVTIGTISSIYADAATGAPGWAAVRLRRFGGRSTLVPLRDVESAGDQLRVSYSRERVRRAPMANGAEALTQRQEAELREHFGLAHSTLASASAPVGSRPAAEKRAAAPGRSRSATKKRRATAAALDDAGRERLERIRGLYRAGAAGYDANALAANPVRRHGVAELELAPGQVVLDIGCGTGLAFEALVERVGPEGRVIGIDASPEMLALAGERVKRKGWDNVELVESAAEEADPGAGADAALLCFAHDVLRSGTALDNVLASVRPGGRVTAVGSKWGSWWAPGMNSYLLFLAAQYTATFDGLDCPWTLLEERLPALKVQTMMLGTAFSATGHAP